MAKLAINRGPKAAALNVASWPVHGDAERRAVLEVLESGKWFYGEKVAEFEQAFAAYQDARYGVSCVNGTAAIEIACVAAGIGAGSEVITTPYTFVATAAAPLRANATPVFVDILPDSLNIDPDQIEAAITPRTKAIIPVHFGGLPCDMDRINAIAEKHDLIVIEDAAHCWGTKWKDKGAGALGALGTFSFQQSKNITAGEGGIILSDNEELAEAARSYSNVGRSKAGQWYEHYRLGSNYRLTEIQAAILLAQMTRIQEHVELREENAAHLTERLEAIEGIQTVPRDPRVTQRAWHLYNFFFMPEQFGGLSRDRFMEALKAEGLSCSGGYPWPLYRNPMFQRAVEGAAGCPLTCPYREADPPDYGSLHLPNAEAAVERTVWFSHPVLLGTRADMDAIADAVEKIRENVDELI